MAKKGKANQLRTHKRKIKKWLDLGLDYNAITKLVNPLLKYPMTYQGVRHWIKENVLHAKLQSQHLEKE